MFVVVVIAAAVVVNDHDADFAPVIVLRQASKPFWYYAASESNL